MLDGHHALACYNASFNTCIINCLGISYRDNPDWFDWFDGHRASKCEDTIEKGIIPLLTKHAVIPKLGKFYDSMTMGQLAISNLCIRVLL